MTLHTSFPTVGPTCSGEVPVARNAQRLPSRQGLLKLNLHERTALLDGSAQTLYEEMQDFHDRKVRGVECRRDRKNIVRRWKRLKHQEDLIGRKLRVRARATSRNNTQNESLFAMTLEDVSAGLLGGMMRKDLGVPRKGLHLSRSLSEDPLWRISATQQSHEWSGKSRRVLFRFNMSQLAGFWQARELSRKSKLFRDPSQGSYSEFESFLAALNCLVISQMGGVHAMIPPPSLSEAIGLTGSIDRDAEMLYFGRWLMLGGTLASRPDTGKPGDEMTVLRTVAVATGELLHREWLRENWRRKKLDARIKLPRWALSNHITGSRMQKRWAVMYGEVLVPSKFKVRLAYARQYLDDYLADLAMVSVGENGRAKLRSSHMEKVRDAITVSEKNS